MKQAKHHATLEFSLKSRKMVTAFNQPNVIK